MSVSPHEGGGSASGLIIPDNIPGDDLKPWKLEEVARTLRTAGTSALAQATAAEETWAKLPGVLESPQGPTIYAALGTPSESARTIESKFSKVSDALDDFAAAMRPIKTTFSQIKTDAVAFRATIRWDERVWISARETQEYEFDSMASVAVGRGVTRTAADVIEYLQGRGESTRLSGGRVQILAHWTQSSEHIDKNNALMDRLADAYARLQNAEADCANAINRQRDLCVVDVEYIEAWQLKQSGENTVVLPWGSRVDEERNCGESFWWGAGNAGKEALEGVGALVGYNSLIDGWSWDKSWETAGQAWVGALQAIGSLVIMTFPLAPVLGQLGVPVFKEANDLTTGMVKGLLAWDTWAENPSEAAGRVLVNVGSMFIPGAGEVAAAIKAVSAGSRIVHLAGDAASLGDDVLAGTNRLAEMTAKLDGMAFDGLGGLRTVDDLVPAGGRFDLPNSDLLHVGGKADNAPPTSWVDDAPSGPRPHTDDPVAPAPHSGAPDTPTPHSGGPDTPSTPHGDPDAGNPGTGHPGDGGDPPKTDGGGGDTPPLHPNLPDPSPHAGPDGAPLSSVSMDKINAEFRRGDGSIDPARFDEWSAKVSEAYPRLDPGDVRALYDYTTNAGYRPMNEYLRFGTIDGVAPAAAEVASIEARITATTEALAKLPAQPGVTFRGIGVSNDFLAQFVKGESWSDAGFSSSSRSTHVAERFAFDEAVDGKMPAVLEVQGLTGSGITSISRYQREAEVLLQRGIDYEVLAKFLDDDGIWRITLKEIPA